MKVKRANMIQFKWIKKRLQQPSKRKKGHITMAHLFFISKTDTTFFQVFLGPQFAVQALVFV